MTSPKTTDMTCPDIQDMLRHYNDDVEFQFGNIQVVITKGDLTKENVGAIVNSTNKTLDVFRGMLSINSSTVVKRIQVNCAHNCYFNINH